MQIMIGAGGTGGHIYPALAAAEALVRQHPEIDLTFVGSRGAKRAYEQRVVTASGLPFRRLATLYAGPVHGVNPVRALTSLGKMAAGVMQAVGLLLRQRPGAILLTGGWANVPLALAAYALRVPMLVFLPDIEPGRTVQLLGRLARRVATTTDASTPHFDAAKHVVTGYPLRRSFAQATCEAGRAHFGLRDDRPVLLVTGGSTGARTINYALLEILPDLLADNVQVLHITGTVDWDDLQARTAAMEALPGYVARPYVDEMALAYAAADLVLCRSGASVLGELPFFGLPGVLVPYPFAWRYQRTNADYLAERGAAVRLDDERMSDDLLPTLRTIYSDPARLAAMRSAAKALARSDGAEQLANELLNLADETRTETL